MLSLNLDSENWEFWECTRATLSHWDTATWRTQRQNTLSSSISTDMAITGTLTLNKIIFFSFVINETFLFWHSCYFTVIMHIISLTYCSTLFYIPPPCWALMTTLGPVRSFWALDLSGPLGKPTGSPHIPILPFYLNINSLHFLTSLLSYHNKKLHLFPSLSLSPLSLSLSLSLSVVSFPLDIEEGEKKGSQRWNQKTGFLKVPVLKNSII